MRMVDLLRGMFTREVAVRSALFRLSISRLVQKVDHQNHLSFSPWLEAGDHVSPDRSLTVSTVYDPPAPDTVKTVPTSQTHS